MPNQAARSRAPAWPVRASRDLRAQRIERSIAAACASRLEPAGMSWSSAMTMSEPSRACISIDRSGVST
jgi:hypothetical protein